MEQELIYTDGSCVKNGLPTSYGGFGIFIERSQIFNAPIKINRKGVKMSFEGSNMYVTNIRMEGLAIVSTLALYARKIMTGTSDNAIDILNKYDSYDYESDLENKKMVECSEINIVTDSQFWINVIKSWMPSWIRKGIMLKKKNADILLMLKHYIDWYKLNDVKINFIFVRSHQTGKRTLHADSNDIVDILAKHGASNKSELYELS